MDCQTPDDSWEYSQAPLSRYSAAKSHEPNVGPRSSASPEFSERKVLRGCPVRRLAKAITDWI